MKGAAKFRMFVAGLPLIVTAAVFAQTDATVSDKRPVEPPQTGAQVARPVTPTPNTDISGDHGNVVVDNPGSLGTQYSEVGVLLAPKTGYPSAGVKLGNATTSGFKVFNSADTLLFSVLGDGRAGVGPAIPGLEVAKFRVNGGGIPLAVYGEKSTSGMVIYDNPTQASPEGGIFAAIRGATTVLVAGNLHLGYGNSGVINSLESQILQLNAWVDYDIFVGRNGGPNAFRVISNGDSSFVGNVGVGTSFPASKFHVLNTDAGASRGVLIEQTSSDPNAGVLTARKARGTVAIRQSVVNGDEVFALTAQSFDGTNYVTPARVVFTVEGAVSAGNVPTAIRFLGPQNVERMKISAAGDLVVPGNANFGGTVTGGNIKAKYQDVAEWVPSSGAPVAGTVVVLDPSQPNHVIASSRAYDSAVAGVVSAQPGIVLGDEGASKSLVATTGRVRVRVDASHSAIAIGDLLVTGEKPGVAMKSIPIDFQGVAIHRPGTVVGKALEPLASGQGEILVLLSLQ